MIRPRHLLLALGLVATLRAQTGTSKEPAVGAVEGVSITVGDLTRASKFFAEVLDFVPVDEREDAGAASSDDEARLAGVFGMCAKSARLRLGDEHIELTEFLTPRGRSFPADTKSNDRWFQHIAIIVSDMERAYARLRAHHVRHASSAPQTLPLWNQNAGGIRAFYFRDPDGHFLELLQFPPDKGDARWQRKDALFLGIDHTAIVVADTDASLSFYRDTLGLRVAGTSENWGPEQERLNGVFGARLRITALRAERGPAIELLEYLAPGDGRPAPPDLAANDVAHWHVVMRSARMDSAFAELRRVHARLVSPGPVELSHERALAVRDPDGHVLRLRQPHAVAR